MDNLIYIFIITLALCGISISTKIYFSKRKPGPMICPLNFNCGAVLKSKYSSFLGIPLEILGIFFYSLLALSYAIIMFVPGWINDPLLFFAATLTFFGFIFSMYLSLVQVIKIKEWCTWCLMSAGVSTLIFVLLFQLQSITSKFAFLADKFSSLTVFVLSLCVALGLGITAVTEFLFLRFIRDLYLSKEESSTITFLHQVLWLIIILLVISNYTFFLIGNHAIVLGAKFLAKMIILLCIIIVNILYGLIVAPMILELFPGDGKTPFTGHFLRKIPFVLGSLSLASWFSLFTIEIFNWADYSILQIMIGYFSVSVVFLVFGQILRGAAGIK